MTLTLLLLLAAPDILVLKDGRILTDKRLSRGEDGVVVHFENGEVRVPSALIEDALIEGEPPPPAETPEEEAQRAKGLVRFEGKWMSERRRDELLHKRVAERRAALEEAAAHMLWRNRYQEETKNFRFEHTVPPAIFAGYRDLMEAYFTAFTKEWKVKPPRDLGKLKVCFYTDYESFLQVGGAGRGVLGYFRFVRPMELNFYYDRLDPAGTEEVMFHEANHYLQKLIDPGFAMPHFPGEALAEYYGASRWDPGAKRITTGLVLEGRLVEVMTDIQAGEWMGLEKLVGTNLYEHYTWGWSLVHFLMSDPRLARKFQRFVLALPSAKDVERAAMGVDNLKTVRQEEVLVAFKRYMGVEDPGDLRELEREWHRYVERELELVSARGLEEAAQRAASMNPPRPIKAKRLFQEALDAGSENPLTFHRYAELLSQEGEFEKAIGLWRRAIERDPLNADFYGALAGALYRKGEKDEAKRLQRLAREIDPHDPWLAVKIEVLGGD